MIDSIIYIFHMPIFFFLSGLVFAPRLLVASGAFLASTSVRLLWPLILWTYLFLAFRVIAGAGANQETQLADLLVFPLPPYAHMWFLWALFLIHVLVHMVLAPLQNELKRAAVLAAFLASFPLLAFQPFIPDVLSGLLQPALLHLPYFLLGLLCAGLSKQPAMQGALGLICFVAFVAAIAWMYVTSPGLLAATGLTCVAIFCLTLAVMSVERHLGAHHVWQGLQVLGLASMVIYLTHTLFSAALRIVLGRLGITETNLHLLLGTVIGIAVPLLIWRVTRHRRSAQLLGFA